MPRSAFTDGFFYNTFEPRGCTGGLLLSLRGINRTPPNMQWSFFILKTYITLQEKNTILQNEGIVVEEISEINSILASVS